MASEKLIKGRIKSAKNISQITQAMQIAAAAKMRKAQAAAVSGRPYAQKIAEVTAQFVVRIDSAKHPLLQQNVSGKKLIILISTNKGLCGGLNTSLFRYLTQTFESGELESAVFVTLGKKGEQYLLRTGRTLLADFSTQPFSKSISALTTFITQGFLNGEFREVHILYNNFLSALKQEPSRKKILPIGEFKKDNQTLGDQTKNNTDLDFVVEPSVEAILDELLFHYLENQIRDAVLEAEASEYSARMIAMKNATDNANELVDLLTLEYNKARQEKITYEIADMITARLAVEG